MDLFATVLTYDSASPYASQVAQPDTKGDTEGFKQEVIIWMFEPGCSPRMGVKPES